MGGKGQKHKEGKTGVPTKTEETGPEGTEGEADRHKRGKTGTRHQSNKVTTRQLTNIETGKHLFGEAVVL